jgi:hypothetical protein
LGEQWNDYVELQIEDKKTVIEAAITKSNRIFDVFTMNTLPVAVTDSIVLTPVNGVFLSA